jgi:CspA family cold shock protein
MHIGTVKWFNSTKGYGFVEPNDKSRDVFIHISALEQAGLRDLNEGQKKLNITQNLTKAKYQQLI